MRERILLWFAFKLISLSYWIQRTNNLKQVVYGCDLLSNLYLCHIEYSRPKEATGRIQLWFAFKLISLSYWIQPISMCRSFRMSCDLLSNLYLCHIEYSDWRHEQIDRAVVICFQTYIFVILNTAFLWCSITSACCDLLSNLYLCHIEYSNRHPLSYILFVVICFQTYIFVILNTAVTSKERRFCSCDLLSNLYLCHIEYSFRTKQPALLSVVICFQTYIFVILNTAMVLIGLTSMLLWFAFKLISLSYWIQLRYRFCCSKNSCDLLSNLYLCHIEYSAWLTS